MYSVLIVDDDIWVQRMLKEKIPWKTIGISDIHTAGNGINALKIIDKFKPLIVISDIKMDGMDGIELLKEVKYRYPEIKIIIVSAYDDFSYAQAGIKNGASDYLLKPVEENTLLNTVKKTMKEIENEENNKFFIYGVEELFKQGAQFLHESLLRNLINGNQKEVDTIIAYINFQDNTFCCAKYCLIIIQYNSCDKEELNDNQKLKKYRCLIKNIFFTWLDDRGIVIDLQEGKNLVFLIGLFEKDGQVNIDSLYEKVSKNLSIQISFVYSSWFTDIHDSEQMYRRFDVSLYNYFYRENSPAVSFCSDEELVYQDIFFHFDQEELFRNALLINDATVAWSILEKSFYWFLENNVKPNNLKFFSMHILRIFVEVLRQYNISAEELNTFDINNENVFRDFKSYFELKLRLLKRLEYTMHLLQKKNETKKRKLIEDIVSFIEVHYAESVSLENISERFLLNPTYLSRLFKNSVGKNFSQFLTETRINKAKELLRDPCMLIYTISAKVGYNNEKYFYKIFKEIEGITPSQYRDQVIR